MTADSLTNDDLPRSPITGTSIAVAVNDGVNSPLRHGVTSPWTSAVRENSDLISSPTPAASRSSTSPLPAALELSFTFERDPMESSSPGAQPESSNVYGDGNAGRPRRHTCDTTINGVVEPSSVMVDAVSCPALPESIRAVPGSSSEPFRPIPNGSASSSQGPIISQPPQRQANTNAPVNSTVNNMPTRQRSRHRGRGAGGGSSSGNGPSSSAFIRPSPPQPPLFPVFNMPYAMVVPPLLDTTVRGTRPGRGVWGSQQHNGNHSSPRNNSRRGNYGYRPRGDGSHHSNHGARRDQDRKDFHLSHQYVPLVGYIPSPLPTGAPPLIAAPPAERVFPGQMAFDMSSPFIYAPTLLPESFRPMPIMPPPPMLFATSDSLPSLIVKQIDYYFSDENLVKDNFLRFNMDDQGWVPITLIASFPRVQQLTYDVPLILDSLRNSTIVEVQGDRLRKRKEWKKWLHNAGWSNTNSGSHAPVASQENVLATSFQKVSLDDATVDANGTMNG